MVYALTEAGKQRLAALSTRKATAPRCLPAAEGHHP
jgi:hypothetical protein